MRSLLLSLLALAAAAAALLLAPAPPAGPSLVVLLPAPLPAITLPPVEGRQGRPLVVIDAGHGGHDPGALAADGVTREKDLTLAFAQAVRLRLLRDGRMRVALTRGDDRYLLLVERTAIARALKADLFISLHADSAGEPGASGATIYVRSEAATDPVAARLAARENRVDRVGGVDLSRQPDDVSATLLDLARRETTDRSTDLADRLIEEGQGRLPLRHATRRAADFVVLRDPEIPAVLFELGYLSNAGDAARLTAPATREAVAETIARGADRFLARR